MSRRLRSAACVFAAVSLFASSAAAQEVASYEGSLPSGVSLPPTGAALVDEATAPEVNPAGLAFVGGGQLFYLHERDIRANRTADGLFLANDVFDIFSAGVSAQWVRGSPGGAAATAGGLGLPGRLTMRKLGYTLALGSRSFSIGGSYNVFASSTSQAVDQLTTFDLGLMLRPSSWLSCGASVRNVDAPTLESAAGPLGRVPRVYDIGLGFRPFTDRITLAGDFIADDVAGLNAGRLSWALGLEVLEGLVLHLGASHPVQGNLGAGLVAQVGLTLNAANVGLSMASAVVPNPPAGSRVGSQLVQLRLSSDDYPSLRLATRPWAVLDLAELVRAPETPLVSVLPPSGGDPYFELLGTLQRMKQDDDLGGVVLKISGIGDLGRARFEELRTAISELRGAGKKVVALVMDAEDDEYYLATAAEKIYAVPQATFLVNGYTASATFLAGALTKLGVKVDVARVGAYKNAPDEYTRTDMSPEQREVLDEFLDGIFERYVAAVSEARKIPAEQFKAALASGILAPDAAQKAGLIDGILYPDELQDRLGELTGQRVRLTDKVGGDPRAQQRWGVRPRVAVIPITGTIAEGKSRSNPFGALSVAGAETILEALSRANDDPDVVAIVVRVDSPGGSGAASDLIWRAIKKVRENKPVVASMGDYAASGGYYVAMAGQEIFAEPSTLTGSIGVFAVKPSIGPLLEKLGINRVTLNRGDKADLLSLTNEWSPEEQQAMQQYIDSFYDTFITKVAESREMTKEAVDQVARGRVWSGARAIDIGLVDELGGLREAVTRAKVLAGYEADRDLDVHLYGRERGFFSLPLGEASAGTAQLQRAIGDVAHAAGIPLSELPDGPLAMLPWRITIR